MKTTTSLRGFESARLGIVTLLLLLSSAPRVAWGGWDPYGEVRTGAGVAENPRLADPNAPASERSTQLDGTLRLLAGLRAGWDRTTFDVAYSPAGDFYTDGNLSRISHALVAGWTHDYSPRSTLKLQDSAAYTPGLALNPAGIQRTSLPVGRSGTVANDAGVTFEFRKSARTTLLWTVADSQRLFSSPQFVDSANQAVGFEIKRGVAPHNSILAGYQYGAFSFNDGTGLSGTGVSDPNIIVPGCDPAKDPNCRPSCKLLPLDPNCLLPNAAGVSPAPSSAPALGLAASDLGATRHRPYAGYAFDPARGFHLDVRAGYDFLVFDQAILGAVTTPYVQSSIGWKWARAEALAAYGQGIDEGGGVFANAMTRSARLDVHVKLSDRVSATLGGGGETREALEAAGGRAAGRLSTALGTATVDVRLDRRWSVAADFTQYVQKSSGLAESLPDVRTRRVSIGAICRFGRSRAADPARTDAPPPG